MSHLLYSLPALACPVGMGLMMWLMMRGTKTKKPPEAALDTRDDQLTRLEAEIAELRNAQRTDHVPAQR